MTDVSDFIDVSDPAALEDAVARAREVLADRGCVVLPTDTVYGIGADAFSPLAVAVLLAAKGRGRTMPPPVLIADRRVMAGLAYDVPEEAEALLAKAQELMVRHAVDEATLAAVAEGRVPDQD